MSKGQQTRATIVSEAMRAASVEGFQGISIGMLAERLKMSKSGLFAHFGSKEELEKAVLDEAADRFAAMVWQPALQAPRGRPRIEALFHNMLDWMLHNRDLPGGCIFMALSVEMDDKPGPVRDDLAEMQTRWQATVARSAQIAVQEGHFRADLDPRQFAFDMQGIMMAMSYYRRLLKDPSAVQRAEAAFADLLARSAAAPAAIETAPLRSL
ncbi:MAG TPA: TetR/AcrR family transcriptional regulator [Ferrovibrio sp.]|uniref:TetR/AcrR family transcriptional regulator n=1 Tax=Ferrovibrio sp. TaxID=1917215 RepID=UPI002ED4B646